MIGWDALADKDDADGVEVRAEGARSGNGYAPDSASVSVSVSSPGGLLNDAGFPLLLNTLTISRLSFSSAKWTFLWVRFGVEGALWARRCLVRCRSLAMLGLDEDDLSDDLRGLPLDRIIGVEGTRGMELERGGEGEE